MTAAAHCDLTGRVAWITGGTAGIGLAIAGLLRLAGASVVLSGRDADRGRSALDQLSLDRVHLVLGDCADPVQARAMADQIDSELGRLDIVVASGGAMDEKPGLFHEVQDDHFERVYQHQFLNRVHPVRAALPMLRRKGGQVLFVGTDAGRHATIGEALHGAIGSAIIMLTKTLAREFARWDIRVNALALTLTSGTQAFETVMSRGDWLTDLYQRAVDRFPRGRAPHVDEVAQVALFLLSAQSSQVTGQTVSVNGGLSFGGW